MTLETLLDAYNFRDYDKINDRNDTQIIRIITDFPGTWFEFGMDDFHDSKPRDFIRGDVLRRNVDAFRTNDTGIVEIILED